MKITDYGLWFVDYNEIICSKKPYNLYLPNLIFCDQYIGYYSWVSDTCYICLDRLDEFGFKISPNAPGKNDKRVRNWILPKGYLPSESDLEEIE